VPAVQPKPARLRRRKPGRSRRPRAPIRWTDGRNFHILRRFTDGDADRARAYAAELVALAPDLVLTSGASTVGTMLQVSRSVPVVFVGAADPVGAGFVDSLARRGSNATGFTSYEYT
jgi:putative ABC transport system substrate-binding protein